MLDKVCKAERVQLPPEFGQRVAAASERNVRRALRMLEASKVQAGGQGLQAAQPVAKADWQDFIGCIAAEILQEQSPRRLFQLRAKFYELLTNCIPVRAGGHALHPPSLSLPCPLSSFLLLLLLLLLLLRNLRG
eukprot:SAG22_NODE_6074_length_905_cov_0.696030_1_plen_133_part_10